jgi:hypothetical protein
MAVRRQSAQSVWVGCSDRRVQEGGAPETCGEQSSCLCWEFKAYWAILHWNIKSYCRRSGSCGFFFGTLEMGLAPQLRQMTIGRRRQAVD